MARRLGPYAPLSATYAHDDAIIEAGEQAELLYVRGLAFCAASESDGFITKAQLKRFVGAGMDNVMDRAERLVEVGLWEEDGGGYVVRAWLKWNASAEELGRARRKDRERKAAKKAESSPPDDDPDGQPERRKEVVQDSPNGSEGSPDGFQGDSERNPSGIQVEAVAESGESSDGSPDGFQPRAGARVEARAGDSLNSTPHNENPPAPQGGKRGSRRASDSPEFDTFWEIYPRKVGKDEARKAWDKAIKAGVLPGDIIDGAKAYLRDPIRCASHIKFTAHPATWLNQGRWKDEPAQQAASNGGGGWWNN